MDVITESKTRLTFREEDIIGCGFHATVFRIDKQWVGRWSVDPKDGFQAIWEIPDAFLERLALPRIKREGSNFDELFFMVERLSRVDTNLFIGSCDAHRQLNNVWLMDEPKFILSKYMLSTHPLYDITKKVYTAWRYLRMKKIYVSIDLSPSNIMMREDGTLILSDPFGQIYLDLRKYLTHHGN